MLINYFLKYIGFLAYRKPWMFQYFFMMRKSGLRIVYYHSIGFSSKNYHLGSGKTSIDDFVEQLNFLSKNFIFISIHDALELWSTGHSLDGYFAITTDDGFQENYTQIAPILLEKNLSSTIYLISNCIENRDLMWRNKLNVISSEISEMSIEIAAKECASVFSIKEMGKNEGLLKWSSRTWEMRFKEQAVNFLWEYLGMEKLEIFLKREKPYLTVGQIKELSFMGFEFGAHSKSHPYFNKLNWTELVDELIGSVNDIKMLTGIRCETFSYPFGIRPARQMEKKIISEFSHEVESLLGIKSSLRNSYSSYSWDRDLMENDLYYSLGRFIIVPLLRHYLPNRVRK